MRQQQGEELDPINQRILECIDMEKVMREKNQESRVLFRFWKNQKN